MIIAKGIIVAAIVGIFGFVGHFDAAEERRQHDRYCEMVAEWHATSGDAGWPAYREGVTCDE
jgi:hypothetical protein